MSRRRVQLVLLCEDRQHGAFLRRFFEAAGWAKRDIELILNPKGRGSGEQWVRERYASEVKKLRSAPHVARGLVVAIDEDRQGAGRREAQLTDALRTAQLASRGTGEAILHVIPGRNVETWLAYLGGATVDEATEYPKLSQERRCAPMVSTLKTMCDGGTLRQPAPPSLDRACVEYRTRLS